MARSCIGWLVVHSWGCDRTDRTADQHEAVALKATVEDMRRALQHVKFFNLEEAEKMLPQWKKVMSRLPLVAAPKSAARLDHCE